MSESKLEIDDDITTKYDIKKRIGKGAYGIVWKAIDKKTKELVAVKKIFDAFANQTDAQRTFREINFLKALKAHQNIVKLYRVHKANNNKDIYLVFEYMETDLHNVIQRGNILRDINKRYITYQLLKAVEYIHSGNIIHRDLKPSNILINGECCCKVADFGLARSMIQLSPTGGEVLPVDALLTDYVTTRWYRAPEVLVASKQYTKGIDMWSIGCILGEMLLGKPIFPGSSTVNQIEKIMATIGTPSSKDIDSLCTGYGGSLLKRTPPGPKIPLSELLNNAPKDGLDLASKLLIFNPNKRLTAAQALKHPYVVRFHSFLAEPPMEIPVMPKLQDDIQLTIKEYRNKLYRMITQNEKKQTKINRRSTEAVLNRKFSEPVAYKVYKVHHKCHSPNSGYQQNEKTKDPAAHPIRKNTETYKSSQVNVIRRHSTGSHISSSQIPVKKQAINHNVKQSKSEKIVTNKNSLSAGHTNPIHAECKTQKKGTFKNIATISTIITRPRSKTASLYNLQQSSIPSNYNQKYGYVTTSQLQEIRPGIRW